MNRKAMFLLATTLLLLAASNVNAQESRFPKFVARVKLSVSGSENIKDEVVSYLSRELRSIGDVVIVDQDAQWELDVIAMELTNKSRYKIGLAFSVVVIRPFNTGYIDGLFKDLPPNKIKAMKILTSDLSNYEGHWLQMGAPEDLRELCRKITADFDGQHLEAGRKEYQKAIDILSKPEKE